MKSIKSVLQKLNNEIFFKIQERVLSANNLLKDVQVRALQQPSAELFLEEQTLHEKWMFLRRIEEACFKQKSRINWLKEVDLYTTYFHRVAVVRAAINSIRSFLNHSGGLITDPEAMAALAISHFKNILAPDTLPFAVAPLLWFQTLLAYRCSPDSILRMSVIPDASAISRTILKLNPNKSPVPMASLQVSSNQLGVYLVMKLRSLFSGFSSLGFSHRPLTPPFSLWSQNTQVLPLFLTTAPSLAAPLSTKLSRRFWCLSLSLSSLISSFPTKRLLSKGDS